MDTLDLDAQPSTSDRWRDIALLGLLLLSAFALRSWLLLNTEVPARDTIGFIRYALQFETDPWTKVLADNHQHPAYPLTVFAMSVPVRAFIDLPQTDAMALSSQLASGLAAVLLVIPMYYLGKLLFHPAAGFLAALLFQCLPVPAHILSDGLSEALFLLFSCSALAFAVAALRGGRPWVFAMTGAFCGLAYLTRPEGALVGAATLIVLIALHLTKSRQRSLGQLLACGGALTLAAVAVGSPYMIATRGISNKPSIQQMFGAPPVETKAVQTPHEGARTSPTIGSKRLLLACMIGLTFNLSDSVSQRAYKAVLGIANELVRCFHYGAVLPLLLGLWWFRGRLRTTPECWVVLVLCGMMALAVWRLAVHVGYFSDRHLLLLVMCGCYPAAAAVVELPTRWSIRFVPARLATALIFLGILLPNLPKALDKLHGNRSGHHAAGLWLAQNAESYDVIEDDHCWAHYYAGHVFRERIATPPPGQVPVRYVVIGRRDREINLTWNRQGPLNEEKLRADGGRVVYHWPAESPDATAPIVIYAFTTPPITGVPR